MERTTAKPGRPTVITEAVVIVLESAFRDGLTVLEGCRLSGISRNVFYEHMRSDERFNDRMKLAQDYLVATAKRSLRKKVEIGDPAITKWVLEKKAKREYGAHPDYSHEDDEYNWRRKTYPTSEEVALDEAQKKKDEDLRNMFKDPM